MIRPSIPFLLAVAIALPPAPAQNGAEAGAFSFAVLGNVRGDPVDVSLVNPLLAEVAADCARVRPDLVFLSGDAVWGDYWNEPPHTDVVEREWDAVERELAPLQVPVYAVPGHHDVSDAATRNIFMRRHGPIPRAVRFRGALFLLLSTAWIPVGEEAAVREPDGVPVDQAQLDFLRAELEKGDFAHAFVIVHHAHWWRPNGYWWLRVHPLLTGKNVRAVIAGEYGPTKYSHCTRDGIDYVQACIAAEPSLDTLRSDEDVRLLSQQLDGYLLFTVDGEDVRFELRTVGLTASRHTPERFREVDALSPTDYAYYATIGGSARRRWLALGLCAGGFAAGVLCTLGVRRLLARRRAAT
jgi:hypothetical protein